MDGKRFIRSIRLENLLSFGSPPVELELEPLNVLIGPNASGKSNLIEALSLLAAAPTDLKIPFRDGGGIREWIWKGAASSSHAMIDVAVALPADRTPLRYILRFGELAGRFDLFGEAVDSQPGGEANPGPEPFYAYLDGHGVVAGVRDALSGNPELAEQAMEMAGMARAGRVEVPVKVKRDESVLSQLNDSISYPELAYLATHFREFRLYREWGLGRDSLVRRPQQADLTEDYLLEDASNLALVVNDLENRSDTKGLIVERLRVVYPHVADVTTKVQIRSDTRPRTGPP